jgi:SAM-dependent methyltransferase
MSTVCKYMEFNDAPGSAHNRIVELVPEGARVLEFGCATGYMSAVLKERRGATVTGIEIVPEAAELAKQHADRVIVGDAEALDYADLLGDEQFDAIVFADVLEHLREPGVLLERIRPFLAEEGVVAASIPNVAHGSVRLALLAGDFRYNETGLLDETHLRFFTRTSIQELFERSGYAVVEMLRQRVEIGDSEIRPPFEPPPEVRELLAVDPDATTYQFIVRAVPAGGASELAESRRELASLRSEVRELEAFRATVDDQAEHIDALQERNDALASQVAELRELLKNAHKSLARRDDELQEKEARLLTRRADELKARDEEIHWLRGVVADLQGKIDDLHAHAASVEEQRSAGLARFSSRLKARLARLRA